MSTNTATDVRRARQRARRVIREIQGDIEQFLESEGVDIWTESTISPREKAKRTNYIISRLAGQRMQKDLHMWLRKRQKTTQARAARAAFQSMQSQLPGVVDEADMMGNAGLTWKDNRLNSVLSQIDAGLLYEDGDSIAEEIGDRVTRQIRVGFAEGENIKAPGDVPDIATRVKTVLQQTGSNQGTGVSGMSLQSKAELIAHDSIQDAYVSTSQQRYLNNGFRYARYDAVVDKKTSDTCIRLDGVIIDMVDNPDLAPPNHPWCRSDLIPLLQRPEGESPIDRGDIGQEHMQRIRSTNGFRPTTIDAGKEFNPTALNDTLDRAGGNP